MNPFTIVKSRRLLRSQKPIFQVVWVYFGRIMISSIPAGVWHIVLEYVPREGYGIYKKNIDAPFRDLVPYNKGVKNYLHVYVHLATDYMITIETELYELSRTSCDVSKFDPIVRKSDMAHRIFLGNGTFCFHAFNKGYDNVSTIARKLLGKMNHFFASYKGNAIGYGYLKPEEPRSHSLPSPRSTSAIVPYLNWGNHTLSKEAQLGFALTLKEIGVNPAANMHEKAKKDKKKEISVIISS